MIVDNRKLVSNAAEKWTLRFLYISLDANGQFVIRANDEKTFIQTAVKFTKNVPQGHQSFTASKYIINIHLLEVSANYRNQVTGICGDMNGDSSDDLMGPDDNLVSDKDNLFNACGLTGESNYKCQSQYASEMCPGEPETDQWKGMLVKRNDNRDFLDTTTVDSTLFTRDESDVTITLDEAVVICTNYTDQHDDLQDLLSRGTNGDDWWTALDDERNSLVDGCASEFTLGGSGTEGQRPTYLTTLSYLGWA